MNHAESITLGRAMRLVGEHGDRLTAETTEGQLHEIRADIKRALALLDASVTTVKPTTRCPEHPAGPVDESAPDLCLLCETRRRSARYGRFGQGGAPAPVRAGDGPPSRVRSSYGIRDERPGPQERWIPEMWNGRHWQLCGTPRRSRRDAESYLTAEHARPMGASAHRLVHAFTEHVVVRVWGGPAAE
ncbi:hypothetical protein [Streptomyces sp. NPDC093109]|uniref:hypothetical protein n=1 Tax=Streptomyces sp. NPDC093109 TaxID=3154977 RepID=UPI00344C8205